MGRLRDSLRLLLAMVLVLPAASWAGSYDIASHMLVWDIVPGTEQVEMIADGGMEQGGTAAGWQKKGGRWGAWTVGPHLVPAPGVCGTAAVYCDHETASGSHQIDGLPGYQRDWLQVFGLYAWLPGPQCSGIAPGVPGEQHICFFKPLPGVPAPPATAWNEPAYLFGDFRPKDSQLAPAKHSYNIKGGIVGDEATSHPIGWTDAKGKWRSVVMAGDNMADTSAVEFSPPVLRYAALAEFAAWAQDKGDSPNVAAGRHMLRFLRDPQKNDEALRSAIAEWEKSLKAHPNQPLVAHWLKLYRGYAPPRPYAPPKPPAGVMASQPIGDRAQLQRCTYLRMRDVIPGTESVRLIANGDFAQGTKGWSAQTGMRVADVSSGLTSRLRDIGTLWGGALVVEAPLESDGYAEVRSDAMTLAPGQYVISAWVTPLGLEPGSGDEVKEVSNMGAIAIGLEGGGSLWWGWPARHAWLSHEGFFVFATITVGEGDKDRRLRIRVGPWNAKQAAATWKGPDGKSVGVCAIIDEVAITPAEQFRPPAIRYALQLESRRMVEQDADTPDEVRTLLKADGADAYDKALPILRREATSPAGRNRLAAACMVLLAREPGRDELRREATAQWKESLEADPAQPAVRYRLNMLKGVRPMNVPDDWNLGARR
jgi:hypothetical protein